MKLFIVDWPMSNRIGSPLDQKDRAANLDVERFGDGRVSTTRLQPVFGFDERRVILFLQERKDWVRFQVISRDFLTELFRQISLIKGEGIPICQTDALDAHHWSPLGQSELARNQLAGGHNLMIENLGRGFATYGFHVFDKASEFRQLLRNPGQGNESSFATLNFNQPALDQALNGRSHGGPAYCVFLHQTVLGGETSSRA